MAPVFSPVANRARSWDVVFAAHFFFLLFHPYRRKWCQGDTFGSRPFQLWSGSEVITPTTHVEVDRVIICGVRSNIGTVTARWLIRYLLVTTWGRRRRRTPSRRHRVTQRPRCDAKTADLGLPPGYRRRRVCHIHLHRPLRFPAKDCPIGVLPQRRLAVRGCSSSANLGRAVA